MTPHRPLAFLSMESLEGFYTYDERTAEVLRARGWRVDRVPWRREVDWSCYEAVVVRSPWDYQQDPERFLAVLRAIEAAGTPLFNPSVVAQWNIDKHYLQQLEAAGVPIVPTRFCMIEDRGSLVAAAQEFQTSELVVKPVVGANADGAFRLRAPFEDPTTSAAIDFHRGRTCLVQPFLRSIVEEGEVSLFYFHDRLSHAVLKRPAPGDFRVQEEHGGKDWGLVPDAALAEAGARAMAALPFRRLLFARVDLAQLDDGRWVVMEVELIEPSLYLEFEAGAAARFADAIEEALCSRWGRRLFYNFYT